MGYFQMTDYTKAIEEILDKAIAVYSEDNKMKAVIQGKLKYEATTQLLELLNKRAIEELTALDFMDFEGDAKPVRIRKYINDRLHHLKREDSK